MSVRRRIVVIALSLLICISFVWQMLLGICPVP
jgi:hypothetical protein